MNGAIRFVELCELSGVGEWLLFWCVEVDALVTFMY